MLRNTARNRPAYQIIRLLWISRLPPPPTRGVFHTNPLFSVDDGRKKFMSCVDDVPPVNGTFWWRLVIRICLHVLEVRRNAEAVPRRIHIEEVVTDSNGCIGNIRCLNYSRGMKSLLEKYVSNSIVFSNTIKINNVKLVFVMGLLWICYSFLWWFKAIVF